MIQFNLLPDVKLEFIKAKRIERLAISISTIAVIICVVILIIMFGTVDGLQKKSLHDVNADIAKYSAQIKSTPSLNKILTIQNQLNALPALESQKPVVTRLSSYIAQVTPQEANLSQLTVDFSKDTLEFTGTADTLGTVDKFVDTLKYTTYSLNNSKKDAFSNVVLTSFGRNAQNASFDITADFDPTIFNEANNLKQLNVPNEITTRSELDQPQVLFDGPNPNSSTSTKDNTTQ